jgi:hypothetical protein
MLKVERPKLGPLQQQNKDDSKFHDPVDSKVDDLWGQKLIKLGLVSWAKPQVKYVVIKKEGNR